MVTIREIHGFRRQWFLLRLKTTIFFHFLPLLLGLSTEAGGNRLASGPPPDSDKGRDPLFSPRALPTKRFVMFLRRLLLFLSKLDHNKFVKIGSATRMDLYVPSFPTPAFYAGCQKFLHFDEPLPCVTALISVTSACRFSCPHCYQKRDRGHDIALDALLPVVRKLQNRGVAFFNLEGGEPFLVYDRLKSVCSVIDQRSEVWVNSTGDGMTLQRLRELRQLNLTAIMFSLHTADPARLNAFMRSDQAWELLKRGIDLCHQAEVPVAFNSCLGREDFYNGEFERVMDRAKEFNGCLVQLIKPKQAGAWLEAAPAPFSRQDLDRVATLVQQYNHARAYAAYPAISAQILVEDRTRFGCTAGGTDRFYINAKGDVQPCEFLNISFGSIGEEDFDDIYTRMRRAFSPAGETWLCEACTAAISHAYKTQGTATLPLAKEASSWICDQWDRGNPTKFYSRMGELK
jgi:MoaA/NifB/PqqE/SkfB family radical SAM enzyme